MIICFGALAILPENQLEKALVLELEVEVNRQMISEW